MRLDHEQAVMAEQCTGRGRRGVVCAAAPLAALAGARLLAEGANAFDAAVAAALCETVLLPPKCGFGGDLVALAVTADDPTPRSLLAIGGAPAGLADVARHGVWRDVGPTSVGPPGAPAGYAALAAMGTCDRATLAGAARDLAANGFPWAAVCTRLAEQAAELVAEFQPDGTRFYPGGQPIAPGTLTVLPGLAQVLEAWIDRGAAVLDGPLGTAIVATVQQHGGVLAADEVASARAEFTACAARDLGGLRVWATAAPTHGPVLLDALSTDPDAGHRYTAITEAVRRHAATLHDPSGTSMVSAADADGNAVVVVHSNSYPRFGSGLIVPGYDLVLANRAGRGFDPDPDHPNFPVRGRRPATTLHAWATGAPGGPVEWLGGTPGGANQVPWNAQVLGRLLAGVHDPGVLVTAALWEAQAGGGLRVERGLADDERAQLAAVGGAWRDAPRWGAKSAIQVIRRPAAGSLFAGAADPRTQGAALGV